MRMDFREGSHVDPRAPADARSNNPLTAVVHCITVVCINRKKFIRFSLYMHLNAFAFIFSLKFSHSKLIILFFFLLHPFLYSRSFSLLSIKIDATFSSKKNRLFFHFFASLSHFSFIFRNQKKFNRI